MDKLMEPIPILPELWLSVSQPSLHRFFFNSLFTLSTKPNTQGNVVAKGFIEKSGLY